MKLKWSRRQGREWAIQMLTAADLNPPDDDLSFRIKFWQQIQTIEPDEGGSGGVDVRDKPRKFTEERYMGVMNNIDLIDSQMAPLMEGWEMSRLNPVERAAIRMACWELYFTDIPVAVIINEAVDLVNWYASPKGRLFVNSVLDKYAKSPATIKVRAQRAKEKAEEEARQAAENAAAAAANAAATTPATATEVTEESAT